MIKWYNPLLQLPPDGTFVACMSYHWKECWPLSAEIIFGEVESYINDDGNRVARVNTCDFTGGGNYKWNFPVEFLDHDCICAWCFSSEFEKPDFLRHNSHWGPEK